MAKFENVEPIHIEPRESEELADAANKRGWGLHVDQVESGEFSGYTDYWPLLAKRCSRFEFSRGVYVHGTTPDLYGFLVPERHEDAVTFNGQHVTPDVVFIRTPGDEASLCVPASHMITNCCFHRTLLEETLQTIGCTTPLKALIPHTMVLSLPAQVVAPLRSLMERAAVSRTRYMEEPLVTSVCRALADSRGHPCRTPLASRNHWRYVRKAIAYVEEHIAEDISLKTLCGATRAGARVLHTAFQEVTGDSPMQFIKRRRLNAARHALFAGEAESVKSAALDHGFWHLRRFAHEYRNLFGERPSETLSRAD
jgi:AraC family ethanolamine operon transcriptional activator